MNFKNLELALKMFKSSLKNNLEVEADEESKE